MIPSSFVGVSVSRPLIRGVMASSSGAVPLAPSKCCPIPPTTASGTAAWAADRAFTSPALSSTSRSSSSSSLSSSLSDADSAAGGAGRRYYQRTAAARPPSSLSCSPRQLSSSSDGDDDDDEALGSARGRRAVSLLPTYLADARSVTKYHPTEAPDGALQLSVAENQMLEDLLLPALRRFASAPSDGAVGALFREDQVYYQPTHGRPGLREAVARYLQRLLRLPDGERLDREGLVCGAGCNAVLENLCFCLAQPGDAVLLPTPYYAAFEFDLVARAGLNIVPVNTLTHADIDSTDHASTIPKSAYYPTTASLDESYHRAKNAGSTPKILLLSHPNNPLGISYPPSVVTECIRWAKRRKVHIVSDEIYAGSVHAQTAQEGGHTFHSALTLASADAQQHSTTHQTQTDGLGIGPYVHFVYALSKDFALSGLRVGVVYSENKAIRTPLQKLNDLCQISSQTQLMVENMLSAPPSQTIHTPHHPHSQLWATDTFLPQNQDRIRRRCHRLQECLAQAKIPYLHADSGMFLWIDLRQFLPPLDDHQTQLFESDDSKDRRERVLYLELLHQFGLLFTPGRSMRNQLPGFFRCVFTAASDDEFDLGLQRIKLFVAAKNK